MDFNSLPRKDLQILCKKNNIRANMTNAAMADALQALDTIEGIEDIQQPTMPETAPVLPESPKRTAVRSTDLPLTCGRTSNRRKPIKDLANPIEDGPKYRAESPMPSAPRTRRGAAAKASTARRRTGKEEQGKEEHVDLPEILAENNRSEMPKTPTTRNGRKRATAATSVRWDNETHIKEEKENENRTAVGLRTYSTRRSSRLSEKKMQEEAPSTRKSRGRKAAVKIASLSVESEDSEKEPKDGFEKSDVQEDEQGGSIKHVSEDRDQDLASEDAATVISVEEASSDNHAAAPESSLPTESCNLESEKCIEDVELREKAIESENSDEDPIESSDTEDDVAAPDGNQAAVLEFSSPTESCNLESEKCEDRDQDLALEDAATVIPVQDVSGGNRVGVLDSSPRTESSESEKFVEEVLELKIEESDAHPTESFAAEDDAPAVISMEEASSDNHAAVLESSLPTESCNLESEKFIEEDVELREKAIESENSDEDPTESSDTEDDVAAPDGNQAAVLEFSSPTASCNLESEKCEDRDQDLALGDAATVIPVQDVSGGNRVGVLDSSPRTESSESEKFVEEVLELKIKESDAHPTESFAAEDDAPAVISVEEASSDNHAAVLESSLPTGSCNLESEKFIEEDVELREKAIESENSDEDPTESSDTEDDVAAPDGNQAAVLEFSSPTESCNLESEKCDPDHSTDSSVVENQMLEREESNVDADRDWYLKDATNEVPGDADLESLASHLVENQVSQFPGDVDLESLVSLLVENLTLESGKCNPDSDASSENSTGNIPENQVLECEICDAVEDMGLKSSSDTEIFVEDNNESVNGMTDPSLPSENLNLEYENCDPGAYENCDPGADSGLDLGVENAKDFFQDDFPPKNPIEGNNSGTETVVADQILNSEIFNGNTGQDTKLKSIIISTVENLVVEGPENQKHGSDAIPYPHENPNMPATEIDGELPASDHAVSQTPMTLRSNRADASDSGKMSGNKSKSLRLSNKKRTPITSKILEDADKEYSGKMLGNKSKSLRLSNKKRTPIRSKILEDADKENSGKMLGTKSNQSLRLSLSNKKWTPIKGKVLENADKENNNVGGDSGKRKPKEFGSLRKVMTAAVVEDVNKGEARRQRSLDKKSLRQLKIMLKEKIIGNANNELLQKRSALQMLTENCLLGNGDN